MNWKFEDENGNNSIFLLDEFVSDALDNGIMVKWDHVSCKAWAKPGETVENIDTLTIIADANGR